MKFLKPSIYDAVKYHCIHVEESITEVAQKFSIDRHTLSKYCEIGVDRYQYISEIKMYVCFSLKESLAINECRASTMSVSSIAKKYGFKQGKLRKMCEYSGFQARNAQCKYHFNRNALAKIENEHDAYILGFLLADG